MADVVLNVGLEHTACLTADRTTCIHL